MNTPINAVLQGNFAGERTFQFVTGSREQIVREGESMPGGEKAFIPRSAVAEHDAVSSLLSDDGGMFGDPSQEPYRGELINALVELLGPAALNYFPMPSTERRAGIEAVLRNVHSPFYWATHKRNQLLRPTEMASQHLFYAIRMLYNNTVPPVFRVGEYKRYRDVERWNPAYKAQALMELTDAISTRIDRTPADGGLEAELEDQLGDMVQNIIVILAIGI